MSKSMSKEGDAMPWQTPKTDWKAGDIPSAGDFNRIEENARTLKTELENDYVKQSDFTSHKNEIATQEQFGHVRIGSGINVSNGVISIPPVPDPITLIPEATYYVDAVNGNDNNNGLTSGSAFRTLNKAISTVKDKFIHTVTIRLVGSGPYSITQDSLTNMIPQKIYFRGQSSSVKSTITGFKMDDIDNGKILEFLYITFSDNVRITGGTNHFSNCIFSVEDNVFTECIAVSLVNTTVFATTYAALDFSECCRVRLSNVTINGGNGMVANLLRLSNCSVVQVTSTTFNCTSPNLPQGVIVSDGTTAFFRGSKGNIGSGIPFIYCSGAIVMIADGRPTSGPDEKVYSGQIFTS